MTGPGRGLCLGAAVAVGALAAAAPALAEQVCIAAPYAGGGGELADLAARAVQVVAGFPSLAEALAEQKPELCLDDTLVEEQAYFEPAANRIVIRKGLDPDFQLAVIIHELRHLEQFGRDICPTIKLRLDDYVRSRLALEADAAAVSLYVTWQLRAAGDAGPWETLGKWPTHDDLALSFETEMAASGDAVKATSAAYAAWFDDADRRGIYAFVGCSSYLDALDLAHMEPGKGRVAETFLPTLCRMPDGRAYDCFLPP
ncbi:MAG: DUF6782 family putative metallopeptidase [Tabrizicola sp.]|uniref:DUF6782 family putative metallopeptidase n=1 Tax=Tabrizicola sp. TaxID=2005166 RepID=UPI0027324FFC|nr:DUF6782 family putative metallopeptidase [Tabrizicola sp.]MDP3264764.1 hypothetical protein [Tabrizicola sp.]MDP3647499.1 hypothetical protein [Paracoccaceae bacterium]MDZ4067021.1 DUF6782 family putative metallopeptidase [Tabrizicola sp.]